MCFGFTLTAQNYPKHYFSSVLNIPLYPSASFGEIRPNHFHSGIDIRTNERTGYPVFSPADGYISRIKVQASGGGKNLYVNHPNGYTTVYMHLERYAPEIEQYLKEYQYSHHRYEVDINLSPDKIKVKRGQTIGYTGNTGGSGGPHLHYEIRTTSNQETINPLLFSFPINDTIPPFFANIMVKGDDYISVKRPYDTVIAKGNEFYICIEGYDKAQNSTNRLGVYSTEVFCDNELMYRCNISKFLFSQTRDVNAITDFRAYIEQGRTMLMTKKLRKNNFPSLYYKENGILKAYSSHIYTIRCIQKDFFGNQSDFVFFLKAVWSDVSLNSNDSGTTLFDCEDENVYTFADKSTIKVPKGALYDDYIVSDKAKYDFKTSYYIPKSNLIPLKKSISVSLNAAKIPQHLRSKALITRNGSSIGGSSQGNFIQTTSSAFGRFAIAIDTISPLISPQNFTDKRRLSPDQMTLSLKITDKLSDIATYNGWLNGRWILFEYDKKRSVITFDLHELFIDDPVLLNDGKNVLKVEVADKKGNITTAEYTIIK
ncbi:MAG: M23 family metallopeptidase [Bacteroidales bacterium]|jgi:hypothetical protein|nr:M23 family metallopeptidase [Bacteroidales bacterium]